VWLVKLLRDDVRETQPEIAERFHREAKVLAELRHPGIINVVEMDTRAHPPYLILEYIEGQNLSEYLKDHGAVAIDEFKRLAVEITKAIHYVHQQHIVHRDIKASNIMLKPNPEQGDKFDPVLMDFGIARGETTEITLTGSNAVGTIDYMAPEQIESAHDVDHHADTYALGVVFYEMLTGQRPFQGRPAQILFAHLQQPPPNPRELRPEIPDALARVVLRALRKKPEDRFPSLESMQEAILTSD
ncbi:MAG: serine/threonine protein kinase, partial [Anaerolinea sp.]|nr:serine/threonine protein kinase [Anaerolinea sp.]